MWLRYVALLAGVAVVISINQPDLDAEEWLLTKEEMNESTGGFDRTSLGIAVSSSGNKVDVYVTGVDYFSSLYDDVESTTNGDYVYMTGWMTRNDTILKPQTEQSSAVSSVGTVWSNAISRNVTSLSLVWRNMLPGYMDRLEEFKNQIATAGEANSMGERARVIIDGRAPLPSGSHHQKSIIVKRSGETVGYVGGIDLAQSRWDTVDHCCAQSPPCEACEAYKRDPGFQEDTPGWQDVQCRVRGPAVMDIGGNFVARWNDNEKPSNVNPTESVPPKIPPIATSEVASSGVGNHTVQLLRTYICSYQRVCKHGCFSENAPYGETSHRDGLIKAFSKAQNYIYIEDQYFVWEEDLHAELLKSVQRGVQVVVVSQEQKGTPGYETFQYGMITPLREACEECVHAFNPSDGVYVHTKVTIVDDVYMTVGSNNINYRSMTYDTELSIASIDAVHIMSADKISVAKLAHDARVKMWSVHTRVPVEELETFTLEEAIQQFHARAAEGTHIVRFDPQEKKIEWAFEKAVDPIGTCRRPQDSPVEELLLLTEARERETA
mmetsp:Transcript_31431/g.58540  ORF Transcript_31431/g.58540 Transcript_31431/m.58540 type:complete len:550 (-) Transcript_31431:193-1842(-)